MPNGRIKINELPKAALAKDSDIFILENDATTQKISLGSIINYIKEHEEIVEYFVKQAAIGSENGVAPLDTNCKIPHANLPFGTTENTVYDGAFGQALSDSLSSHATDTANPHAVTKAQVGLSDVDNTADTVKPVSAPQQKAIDTAYASSNAYTDTKIAELIDGAPSTLDTLGEIARALQEGDGISDTLDAAIATKASQAELDSHTGNDTIHITSSERTKWNSKMGRTEDACNTTITFSEVSDLSNINSGEKTSSIMGKVSKAVSSLISHISSKATKNSFGHVKLSDTYQSVVSDGDSASGVGASQKALAEAYSALNSRLTDSLGGITFGVDAEGNYGYKRAGADTVTPFKSGGFKNISIQLLELRGWQNEITQLGIANNYSTIRYAAKPAYKGKYLIIVPYEIKESMKTQNMPVFKLPYDGNSFDVSFYIGNNSYNYPSNAAVYQINFLE